MKSKKETITYIKYLDKECINIHPDTSFIKGMIIGLCCSIKYDTKRPSCISSEIWNKYQKEEKELKKKENARKIAKKKANQPECFDDIFGYKED